MRKATAVLTIDRSHPRKDKTCSIYIRITFQRRKKEYPTGISLLPEHFDSLMKGKRQKGDDLRLYSQILSFQSKAVAIIQKLEVFTYALFEELYLSNTEAADTIKFGFERHINDLTEQKRIGTASSYNTALKSIEDFKSGLRYADITPDLLRKYEAYMLEKGKSKTTVGIYLRSLRTIMNKADIDKKLYPFGNGKDKYSIPEGRNIKKALTLNEIKQIFNYEVEIGTTKAMAKDYWIFIYLCNGLNVKDFCLLKYKNINEDFMYYERAKTIRSKRNNSTISIALQPEAKSIIKQYGQPFLSPETYIFPHLTANMSAEKQRKVYQQLTKTINKYMKRIAKELNINKDVTTYYARHSFATILRNSGTSIEFISSALGHSDIKTTKNYLADFEQDMIQKITKALTAFN